MPIVGGVIGFRAGGGGTTVETVTQLSITLDSPALVVELQDQSIVVTIDTN